MSGQACYPCILSVLNDAQLKQLYSQASWSRLLSDSSLVYPNIYGAVFRAYTGQARFLSGDIKLPHCGARLFYRHRPREG